MATTHFSKPIRDPEPIEMGGVIIHPGSCIGNYLYLREIGSGGMARVLLAKDPSEQLIALKVLRQSRFKSGLARFRREFRALSRVRHPNVIRVEAYGDLFGHPYIAMEYVDGPNLHTHIRSFRTLEWSDRWRRVEAILIDLCRALSAVHRRGLVHRDLKPSNVLINPEGVCKLTDFGIVKDLDPSADPMKSAALVGTWAYASPEQITGGAIDHRSDLYSLGVILFAMLTDKRPFVANDMAGYLVLHRDRPAPAPREINPSIPAHLDEICRKLLQKPPYERYQSAQEILFRLEAEDRASEAVPQGDWEPALVGREHAVELLTNAMTALTRREGGVIILEGDDGAGKSRLLDVAMDRAWSVGIRCYRLEFRLGEAVVASLHRLAHRLATDLSEGQPPELRHALEAFGGHSGTRSTHWHALYEGVRAGLARVLARTPVLLALDDLHEANVRELEALNYLVRTLISRVGEPLLVLATLRPRGSAGADAFASIPEVGLEPTHIGIGALSLDDVAQMLFGLVGDTREARLLAQRIHQETEGNAYFVSEFIRSLMASGVLKGIDTNTYGLTVDADEITSGHLEIPPGVRQLMKSRLEGVLPQDRTVLEALSVGGREVDLDVLLEVLQTPEDTVLDSLERLVASGIVRERHAGHLILPTVTHRQFADVVYRDLPAERRAHLHRRMALALELHYSQHPAALEVVGEHYRRAGDAGNAYRYLVAAAKRLAERSFTQEAWGLTEKAGTLEASATNDLPHADFRAFRRDNLTVRANVLYNRAEWAEAERTYRAVLALAEEDDEPRLACVARQQLATVLRRRGQQEASRRIAEQALEESRQLNYRRGIAEALHCMASLAWNDGNPEECERLATEGLTIADSGPLAEQRAELLLALTAAQATRGQLAVATSGLIEAEAIFRELRKRRHRCLALTNIAELQIWQGEPVQARQRAHVATQIALDLDYKLGATAAKRAMAIAGLDLGLYEEANKGLSEALQTARAIELPEEILPCLIALARLQLEQGNAERAQTHAAEAVELASRRDPERQAPLALAYLAQALAGTQPSVAREHLTQAEQSLPELPIPRRAQVCLALAHAYLALCDTPQAQRHARSAMQAGGGCGFRLLSLESRALMAQVSEGEDSATHLAVGRELAREFTASFSSDRLRAFARRPFIQVLDKNLSSDKD